MSRSSTDPRCSEPGFLIDADQLLRNLGGAIHRVLPVRDFTDVRNIFPIAWMIFKRYPPMEPDPGGLKSIHKANEEMKKGNKMAKKGKLDVALHHYNLSLMFCINAAPEEDRSGPCQPSSMSVLYAKRSEVNFKLQRYDACIFDVMQALRFQFSPEKEHELFERMGQCCEELNEFDRAKQSYEHALTSMKGSKNSDVIRNLKGRLQTLNGRARRMKSSPPSLLTSHIGASARHFWRSAPPLSYGPSDDNVAASSAIVFCPLRGGCFATRDIKPGDVLIVEKAYAHEVDCNDELGKRGCDNCFEIIITLTPCGGCSLVAYCSQRCQREAWERYHSVECAVGPYIEPLQEFTFLRLLTRTFITFFNDYVDESRPSSYGTDLIMRYIVSEVTFGAGAQKRVAHNTAVLFCIYACLASRYLAHSKEFVEIEKRFDSSFGKDATESGRPMASQSGANAGGSKSGPENGALCNFSGKFLAGVVSSCMPRCRRVMAYQNVEFLDTSPLWNMCKAAAQASKAADIPDVDASATTPDIHLMNALLPSRWADPAEGLFSYGSAFYPLVSTIRHSCFPNVTDVFYGTTCVIRALRNVRSGEEIVICHGPPLSVTDFGARQRLLRVKAIECRCVACVDKTSPSTFTDRPLFRCPYCGAGVETRRTTCAACGGNVAAEMTRFPKKWNLFADGFTKWMTRPVAESNESDPVNLMSEIDASIVGAHRCRPFIKNMEQLHRYFQRRANFTFSDTRARQSPSPSDSTLSAEDRGDAFLNSFYKIRYN